MATTGNGTAVALLRYVDLTPEEQQVAVARVGVASEEITRVPKDVVLEAKRLWEQHCRGGAGAAAWEAPFEGRCEVQWDPCLGVHGCDHGGNDDLGRQALRAIGSAILALVERPDHTEGSALLDALRNHTATHNDMPLPPTVAGWFQCINPKQHGQGHAHQGSAQSVQAASSVAIPQPILAPLAPLFWVAHLVADPAGDASKHVVQLAKAVIRERWDARWLAACLPLLAAGTGAFGAAPLDACWLALVVAASAGPHNSQASQAVLREVRRRIGGHCLLGAIGVWRNRLEDALRQAPVSCSSIPGLPPLNWSEDVMAPLLVEKGGANADGPWSVALAAIECGHLVVDIGSDHMCAAIWVWLRGANRSQELLAWSAQSDETTTAVCEALGPRFATLRTTSLPGRDVAGPKSDRPVTIVCTVTDQAGLAELVSGPWKPSRLLVVTESTPPSLEHSAEWVTVGPGVFSLVV